MMSGHCSFPATHVEGEPAGDLSHERCAKQGSGNRANPAREFSPCPCPCHLGEEFECANCGRLLREAPAWPNEEEPDEPVYVHVDRETGRAIGEEC